MSDRDEEPGGFRMPGPPPPLPDLDAVSASIDHPAERPAPRSSLFAPTADEASETAAESAAGTAPEAGPTEPAVAAPEKAVTVEPIDPSEPATVEPVVASAGVVPSEPATVEPVVPSARVRPPEPVAPPAAPAITRPSPEVAAVPAASRIPGAPAAGYGRLPTAPVATTAEGPHEPGEFEPDGWVPPERPSRPVVGAWALGIAVISLAASLVFGWMLPLGLIAIGLAIAALRRPVESRAVAVWAIVLGAVSVLYSAGWLLWLGWSTGLLR